MEENMKKRTMAVCGIVSALVLLILMGLYRYLSYAPFGNNSLATIDANIQYLDFFAYLKDVLNGRNDVAYSFSKNLGGTNLAVFSYYLASPLNLLVLFFSKEKLHCFFDLLVAGKLALAGFTFAFFLKERLKEKLDDFFVVCLSLGYALCQYNIAQSSNIMWLDGVYMLPLMFLGVFWVVHERKWHSLAVFTALSVVFNWYTGGINCMFSGLWFLLELFLDETIREDRRKIRKIGRTVGTYLIAMTVGIMLSAFLFLPTVFALQGDRGGLNWQLLLQTDFIGEVPSLIQSYAFGAKSNYGTAALFCGSLALLGALGWLFCRGAEEKRRIRMAVTVLLAAVVAIFYWNPFYALFSLLREVDSYWYRYSYGGIACMIFAAALFFSGYGIGKKKLEVPFLKAAVLFAGIQVVLNYVKPLNDMQLLYKTAVCILGSGVLLTVLYRAHTKAVRVLALCLIAVVSIGEMTKNTKLLMDAYHTDDVAEFEQYEAEQQTQIDALKAYDAGTYRITQTATRNRNDNGLTANYNEAYAFGYWSLAGYTSDPDEKQNTFLEKLGYRINGRTMCIVNTSILGADSLLGVKYILSPYEIEGLNQIEEIPVRNGKAVYENPYCMPFAFKFKYEKEPEEDSYDNPFEYQNALYSKLCGEEVQLYFPLSAQVVQNGDMSQGISQIYEITLEQGEYAVYGNLTWEEPMLLTMDINHEITTRYSSWLSPSVFYIPQHENETEAFVEIRAEQNYNVKEAQFYALDLEKFREIHQKLQERAAQTISVKNGEAYVEVNAEKGESLFVSIPYEEGWRITVNGEETGAEMFEGCMYSIPLREGKNEIQMSYRVKGIRAGTAATCAGIMIFAGTLRLRRIRKKRRKIRMS